MNPGRSVHISEFPHESRRPLALDLLAYGTRHDERGRLQAFDVGFLAPVGGAHHGLKTHEAQESAFLVIPIWIPLCGLGAVLGLGLALRTELAAALLLGYAVMSALTYAAYAMDKSAAQRGRFRTQESALHLLEFVGGWPGALLAQRRLRHKTMKQSYQIGFWAIVVLNLGGLVFILVWGLGAPG